MNESLHYMLVVGCMTYLGSSCMIYVISYPLLVDFIELRSSHACNGFGLDDLACDVGWGVNRLLWLDLLLLFMYVGFSLPHFM